ncbi:MAG TPA: FtsX-like permease family protein, partial [Vicinamibacterales bacterium]|nr:FtsX-like permease family protein [Vicinamibacterales bacterium]
NALWLRALPVRDADRLVYCAKSNFGDSEDHPFDPQNPLLRPFRGAVAGQVDESKFGLTPVLTVQGRRIPEVAGITAGFFHVFGVSIRGRDFVPDDDRPDAAPVAIISHRVWMDDFGGRADVVGATVAAGAMSIRVIGVTPAGFDGVRKGDHVDVWIPSQLRRRLAPTSLHVWGVPLMVFGKLPPGRTLVEMEREVRANDSYHEDFALVPLADVFGSPASSTIAIDEGPAAGIAGGLALLVLIGGCLTLATLILVHYERRAPELATKTALGATRRQLLGELSRELAVVAIAGTAAAVFVAQLALQAMPALSLPGGLDLGRLDLSPDWRVLSVALGATFVTCALAAWLPLVRFTRGTLARTLLAGPAATASPATQRLRQLLLAAQVCAAVIVLASAALFVRTVLYGFSGAAGFDVDHTLFVRSAVTTGFALPSVSDIPTFVATADGRKQRIRDALLQLPGVQQVVAGLPPIGPESVRGLQHPTVVTTERGQQTVRAGWVWDADVDWLSALGVRMLAGRDLRADDARVSPQRVVVTASLANRLWHGGNPLGEKITTPALKGIVVGVSSDFMYGSLLEPAMGTVVTAYHRNTGYLGQWVIRADNALALAGAVEQAVRTAVPDVASVQVQTGRDVVAQDLGQQRVGAWFFSGFGLVALILGVGSVFGLVAYLAESRQREFGVRLALGATASRLMTHGLGAALVPVAVGVVIGLGLSALVAQLFTSALVGVGALDPWAYSAIAAAMLAGAALAALMAAWRLRRIAPIDALRSH